MFFKRNERDRVVGVKVGNVLLAVGAVVALGFVPFLFETVSKGTVKVGYRFGKFTEIIQPGFHFPVNPLVSWTALDTKQKTVKLDTVELPSRDQLTSTVDVSIQYRAIGSEGHNIINETGSLEQVVDVHMIPKIRSLIRDAGRSVNKAEDLYTDTEVTRISREMTEKLHGFMATKGVAVEEVLVRNIELPAFIVEAIQSKKEREQQAERQKAELARFQTEQQQKVAQAQAELDAASKEAEKIKTLADAEAYRIKVVNEAVADNPAYIQLQSLEALKQMSKDPAQKLVIMDGSSTRPIPFLNLGDSLNK